MNTNGFSSHDRSPLDIICFAMGVAGILTAVTSLILDSVPLFLVGGALVAIGLSYFLASEANRR